MPARGTFSTGLPSRHPAARPSHAPSIRSRMSTAPDGTPPSTPTSTPTDQPARMSARSSGSSGSAGTGCRAISSSNCSASARSSGAAGGETRHRPEAGRAAGGDPASFDLVDRYAFFPAGHQLVRQQVLRAGTQVRLRSTTRSRRPASRRSTSAVRPRRSAIRTCPRAHAPERGPSRTHRPRRRPSTCRSRSGRCGCRSRRSLRQSAGIASMPYIAPHSAPAMVAIESESRP